jgi:membrane fusion protein, multidrug efflux system
MTQPEPENAETGTSKLSPLARRIGLIALLVALLGALAWYLNYRTTLRYFQETNDAAIQADQVAIAAKLGGYVRSVAVADNQQVAAGALLAEIDPVDFETRLAAADAGIASAIAAQNASRASRAEAEAGIAQARAAIQAASAGLALANREVERYRPLVAAGAEPAEKLSQLTANRDKALADAAAARASLLQAQRRTQSIAADTARLGAQAGAARVERQGASNDLAATRLTAPIAGRVANRTVRPGQFIQPGLRLMTIVPSQDIYVVANFKETQVGLMRPGQPVTIRADALAGVSFAGKVESITPGTGANFSMIPPQNATGNFTKIVQRVPVRIRIDAGPAARRVLVPGLSLVVEVDTRAAKGELDAIRDEQQRGGK